ncbi:MAG: hypothetical protein IKO47_01130 [Ruminococcus sp.]|nr:hypothetical protein [Ruminococcus sp.]
MWTCPKCETNNRDGDMNCFVCACDYKTYLEYRTVKQKEAAEAAARIRAEEAAARARAAAEKAAKTKAAIASDELKALAKAAEIAEAAASESAAATVKKPEEPHETYKDDRGDFVKEFERSLTTKDKRYKSVRREERLLKFIKIILFLGAAFAVCYGVVYVSEHSDTSSSSSTYKRRSALYPAAYACEQLEYAPDAGYCSLCLTPAETSYIIFEEDSYVDLSEM